MFRMLHVTYNKIDQDRFSVSRPQGENYYIFVHFLDSVRLSVHEHTLLARENSCILFSPNTPHYYESIDHSELHTSFFYFLASDAFMEPFRLPFNQVIPLRDYQVVDHYIMTLFSYVVEQTSLQPIEERATTELLFSYLSKLLYEKSGRPSFDRTALLNRVRLTVFANPATNWNARSIAQLTNLSVAQFYKLYKKIYHISPMEDLNRYRLESAKRLLISGFSVTDVASMIGMSSAHYFTDFFKKRTGCTPTQFLRQR